MTIFILALVLIVALAFLYALVLRPWLKQKAWAKRFFDWIEPFEIALFQKSETILVGRLLWVGSAFVTFYDGIAAFAKSLDLTPLTTRALDFLHIPQDMRSLTMTSFIGALGLLINWLRKRTTKPVELVAAPEATATPEVKVALAAADEAKDQAVATVKAAS